MWSPGNCQATKDVEPSRGGLTISLATRLKDDENASKSVLSLP